MVVDAAGEKGMKKPLFIIPQKAVIMKGGKILLLKRAPDSPIHPNLWDLPGGILENKEKPEEGLKREVFEETNLKVMVVKPLFSCSESSHGNEVFFLLYECRILSGKIKLSKEHIEWKWADKKEAARIRKEPYLKLYLKR